MTSDLQSENWAVLSERGCEASELTHEEARRLVHKLATEGRHGLCIVTSEVAERLGKNTDRREVAGMRDTA
ncbi:MAG TPA: hypothetical protein VGQ72_03745 [Pyrinomonadaceae bacterium]|jgi:hypothetical protein|nr:hypothetical protein [Pyrinomonadaceae bacterium]